MLQEIKFFRKQIHLLWIGFPVLWKQAIKMKPLVQVASSMLPILKEAFCPWSSRKVNLHTRQHKNHGMAFDLHHNLQLGITMIRSKPRLLGPQGFWTIFQSAPLQPQKFD